MPVRKKARTRPGRKTLKRMTASDLVNFNLMIRRLAATVNKRKKK